MDTKEGYFEQFVSMEYAEEAKRNSLKSGGIFRVGEIVEIKESSFRVTSIRRTGLVLTLIK